MIKIVYLFFIFEVIGVCSNATAAEVWTHMSNSGRIGFVVIEGKIEKGDFKKFETSVFKANGKVTGVYTFSNGGDFYEAMKIGSAIRELGLSTQVPMKEIDNSPFCPTDVLKVSPSPKDEKNCACASACFFIHIAGLHRGGNYLAVHRPYFEKGKYGSLSQEDARSLYSRLQEDARVYMKKMNVPQYVQEELMSTPSDKALILSDNVIKKYFWGSLPYRDEWLKNRCSKIIGSEKSKIKEYSSRMQAASRKLGSSNISSHRDMGFTDSEWEEYLELREKEDSEIFCMSNAGKNARIIAFKQYFDVSLKNKANK